MASGQELAQYYVQIIPTTKGIGGKIASAINDEDPGTKVGTSLADKIKKVIAGAAIGKVLVSTIKAAVAEGSKLEQSMGGIEQIFGESSAATETLKKNAQEAFSYAQVSANDYMQQVTQFSAKLMQGLGGDTDATVKYADMAIRQMSDNANTFGTEISSIQNAYQGFAKGNYTMLDNLRLGYGGTASEMARLINDSGVMGKTFKATASNINKVSFDKIIEAIGVMQDKMNITGKTFSEAKSTLEGSANAMKSSFKNLLADIAIGEDASQALEGVVTYGIAYATNLGKAVINVIKGLPPAIMTAMQQLYPTLVENGSELVQKFMDGVDGWMKNVIKSGSNIIGNVISGITKALPNIVKTAATVISKLYTTFISNLPQMVETGKNLIIELAKGIASMIPSIVQTIKEMLTNIWNAIKQTDWLALGKTILTALWEGLKIVVPVVLSTIASMATGIWDKIKGVNWLQLGKDVIQFIINGIKAMLSNIISAAGELAKGAFDKIKDTNWLQLGKDIMSKMKEGLTSMASNIANAAKDLGSKISGGINGQNWWSIGNNIANGVKDGINAGASSVVSAAGAMAAAAANRSKSVLKIASPSKLFEEYGEFIDLGLAKGISENILPIERAMDGMLSTVNPSDLAVSTGDFRGLGENSNSQNFNYGGVNINVYGQAGMSANDIAEEISNILSNQIIRKREVFG